MENEVVNNNNLLSSWAYVGYNILFAIPIVGLILVIVFALDNNNINRRNYARSFIITWLIALAIFILLFFVLGAGIFAASQSMY